VFNEMVRRTVNTPSTGVCSFVNIPSGIKLSLRTSGFSVHVMGPPELVSQLTYTSFTAVADLSDLELSPGSDYYIPVEMSLAGEAAEFPGVFIIGEYGVDVRIETTTEE